MTSRPAALIDHQHVLTEAGLLPGIAHALHVTARLSGRLRKALTLVTRFTPALLGRAREMGLLDQDDRYTALGALVREMVRSNMDGVTAAQLVALVRMGRLDEFPCSLVGVSISACKSLAERGWAIREGYATGTPGQRASEYRLSDNGRAALANLIERANEASRRVYFRSSVSA